MDSTYFDTCSSWIKQESSAYGKKFGRDIFDVIKRHSWKLKTRLLHSSILDKSLTLIWKGENLHATCKEETKMVVVILQIRN